MDAPHQFGTITAGESVQPQREVANRESNPSGEPCAEPEFEVELLIGGHYTGSRDLQHDHHDFEHDGDQKAQPYRHPQPEYVRAGTRHLAFAAYGGVGHCGFLEGLPRGLPCSPRLTIWSSKAGNARSSVRTDEHDRKSNVPMILYAEFTAKPGTESEVGQLISGLAEQVRQ